MSETEDVLLRDSLDKLHRDLLDEPHCDSFAAIDFETATSERNSACAVGVAVFESGVVVNELSLLIRPPDNDYNPFNTALHDIGPADTENSPEFPEVWECVAEMLSGLLVVAHNTAFDMSVLRRSAAFHGYVPDPFHFACTYRVARSSMPEMRIWRLNELADRFKIPLSHHDPLSDAKAAGYLWMVLSDHFKMTHSELLDKHGYRLGYCGLECYQPFSNAGQSKQHTSQPSRSS